MNNVCFASTKSVNNAIILTAGLILFLEETYAFMDQM